MTVATNLSCVYPDYRTFYIVSYDDGHGTIELVSETFTTMNYAQQYIAENIGDLINPQIRIAHIVG